MSDCRHPRLVKVINVEDGGPDSTVYKCQGDCGRMFIVTLTPYQIAPIEHASPDGAA